MNFIDLYRDLPEIQTQRLILRKMRIEDAPAMYSYAARPYVSDYCTWAPHKSILDTEAFLKFWIQGYEQGVVRDWAICRKSDNVLIGTGGLVNWDAPSGSAELGYALHPDYWNQGLVCEAVQAITKWAFQAQDLHRIIAHCMEQNQASARVLEKCGFHRDGHLRNAYRKRGIGVNLFQFSLLRREVLGDNKKCRMLREEDQARIEEITLLAFQHDPVTKKAIEQIKPVEMDLLKSLFAESDQNILHGIEVDGVLVGYVIYTSAPQESQKHLRCYCMSIFGMDPLVQKRGLGLHLLQWSTKQMRIHTDFIFLLGHPGFYSRNGYQELRFWDIHFGNGWPVEACMGFAFENKEPKAGVIQYPKPILQAMDLF